MRKPNCKPGPPRPWSERIVSSRRGKVPCRGGQDQKLKAATGEIKRKEVSAINSDYEPRSNENEDQVEDIKEDDHKLNIFEIAMTRKLDEDRTSGRVTTTGIPASREECLYKEDYGKGWIGGR